MIWHYCLVVLLLSFNINVFLANEYFDDVIRLIILGETGQGKSTTIKNVFKVSDYVPIGHNIMKSETKNVYPYYVDNYIIYDTPGFYDIGNGLTNEQILELIDIELQQLSFANSPDINAMLLILSTHKMKEAAGNHIADYISLFSENMLNSFIVIINNYEGDPDKDAWTLKGHMDATLKYIVDNSSKYDSSQLTIPTVVMNCKHPKQDELNELNYTINNVNPYQLSNLYLKRQEIEKIYDDILLNPLNYKDQIEYMIKNETKKVTKQVLQRTNKAVPVRKCGQISGSILGVVSWTDFKCREETENVQIDIIVDLEEEIYDVPVTEEIKTRVLKNEDHVYWELAKKMYKKEVFNKFKAQNQKTEL